MDMSAEYMSESVQAMASKGYQLTSSTEAHEPHDERIQTDTHVLRRFDSTLKVEQELILESIKYRDQSERYYLEIKKYHGLRSFSFPLDSWRHFDDRIEFKYYVLTTSGLGLSFIVDFE